MSTLYVFAPAGAHTLERHPESADRAAVIHSILEQYGVLADVDLLLPTAASTDQLARVHTLRLIQQVREVSRQGGGRLDPDTYATAASYELARLAAGSAAAAVDAILTGRSRNGFVVIRPPGHHAERDRAGGFCLFNNVAVAARQAQHVHGLERILIVDFDVHHGNGTQEIFYDDPQVLFMSVHLYGHYFYPGTGHDKEVGTPDAYGQTVNVPLPPYVGDSGYQRIFDEVVYPKAKAFRPQLILVSAGYDAHWQDPLSYAGLSLTGYSTIVRRLIAMADELADGHILFVLEGGYFRPALSHGVLNTIFALTGQDQIVDPLGTMSENEADVTRLIHILRERHLI